MDMIWVCYFLCEISKIKTTLASHIISKRNFVFIMLHSKEINDYIVQATVNPYRCYKTIVPDEDKAIIVALVRHVWNNSSATYLIILHLELPIELSDALILNAQHVEGIVTETLSGIALWQRKQHNIHKATSYFHDILCHYGKALALYHTIHHPICSI